ncbi:hypothetical protein BASA83_010422 [Batrachochytrium salamandrivorans]|nr:hypothetical protein BASA83_010422 [Batrachochytrium salamandrivorans]
MWAIAGTSLDMEPSGRRFDSTVSELDLAPWLQATESTLAFYDGNTCAAHPAPATLFLTHPPPLAPMHDCLMLPHAMHDPTRTP